jgi:hypothetical protein
MEEIAGLIDSIVSTIMTAKRAALSHKVLVDRDALLEMLDKLKKSLDLTEEVRVIRPAMNVQKNKDEINPEIFGLEGEALLRQAKIEADKIKGGANQYAESVLDNLLISLTKAESAITNGKERLQKYKR